MLVEIDNCKYLIGIHFYFNSIANINYGIYLNEMTLEVINGWIEELKPPIIPIFTLKEKLILPSTIEELTLNSGSDRSL